MLNEKNQRELAYLVTVDEIREIPGYDRICQYRTGGWWCVSGKGDYQVGDTALYIEIDSLCPYTDEFIFLNEAFNKEGVKIRPDRHKIKTQRFAKGTAISQGLLCPLKDFPQLQGKEVGYFCTKELGIIYYEEEDNKRKASNEELIKIQVEKRLDKWSKKHKFLSKFKFIVNWVKKSIERKIRKTQKKKKTDWPSWVVKTDEERIQNLPAIFNDLEKIWYITEKIDGTSTTFTMKQDKPKNRQLIVCSRNVVYNRPEKEERNYYKDTDGNVYLEMAEKYNMERVLNIILNAHPQFEYITIQGETYGGSIQKRHYCDEHRFAIFNIIYKVNGQAPVRMNPKMMRDYVAQLNEFEEISQHCPLECVPYLGRVKLQKLPTCEDVLNFAHAPSQIDGELREGVVFRSEDGVHSFKAVDNNFLLKYHN